MANPSLSQSKSPKRAPAGKTMPKLVKMATLARESGVPAPTIKHYIREGLIDGPVSRTSKNMAYYDAALVTRITAIKDLQRTRFLPLRVIRNVLDSEGRESIDQAADAIGATLGTMVPTTHKTLQEIKAAGVPARELQWFIKMGIIDVKSIKGEESVTGDDLALLKTLGAARKAGITDEMLPAAALLPYVNAIRTLVELEVSLLVTRVLPRAGQKRAGILEAATTLSEKLVVLLRRKMIVPMLREIETRVPQQEKRGREKKSRTLM
jgi:DNA-binding transcriptional MerR regulator